MRFSLGITLLFVLVEPAGATSFIQQPFPETIQSAPVIVRGRAGASHGDWGAAADGSKRIFTYTELSVDEVLKGSVDSGSILMREMGGEKDGVGMEVSGTARFERGEDVVAMLGERNADGSYDIWGMMMGKLDVQRDPDGHELIVGPAINSLTHAVLPGDAEEGQADTQAAPKWTLEALRKLIRSQGSAPAQSPKPAQLHRTSVAPPVAPKPVAASSPTAPGLQTSQTEEAAPAAESPGFRFLLWIGLALAVGVLIAFGFLRARRQKVG